MFGQRLYKYFLSFALSCHKAKSIESPVTSNGLQVLFGNHGITYDTSSGKEIKYDLDLAQGRKYEV